MARSARTIPLAWASGENCFSIEPKRWETLARAWDTNLTEEVRDLIFKATASFLLWEVFERTAEPMSKAVSRVKTIEKAARGLFLVLHQPHPTPVETYADQILIRSFDTPLLNVNQPLEDIKWTLLSLSRACHSALADMAVEPDGSKTGFARGFREGECWDNWIRELTQIAARHNLPSAAAKGSDKGTPSSPFVRMVAALQAMLPPEARRHGQSQDALAAAIHRARRMTARVRKPRDKKPRNLSR